MENLINILFLADLHYTDKSMLNKEKYIQSFCESVNENVNDDTAIDVLVIAGDICDKGGSEDDYERAAGLIDNILKKINIGKIIVVPGNHDVSRDILLGLGKKKDFDKNELWKYNEKYELFQKMRGVENIKFDIEKVIVSHELIKDRYLLMGINSNYKIGVEDGVGYVDIESLKNELGEIEKKYGQKYKDLIKIVIMHHYPHHYISHLEKAGSNNNLKAKTIGNFDLENWEELKKILNKYGVGIVLTGHVHGSQIETLSNCDEGEKDIYYSSIGSVGLNFNSELADILKGIEKDQIDDSQQETYQKFKKWIENDEVMISISNRHNTYGIITVSEDKIEEQHYKYLTEEGVAKWLPWYNPRKIKWFSDKSNMSVNPFEDDNIKVKSRKKEDVEKKIMDIVREAHLYKTGHFHWKDQCVMNWIDTSILLTDCRYLNMISDHITNRFSEILNNGNYIVGLGVKGAILMSSIRYNYPDKKYTYYPENDENFNEFEKIVLDNTDMDRIVLLTDVVHSGGTIKNFVLKNQTHIVDDSTVEVIAIFSTNDPIEIEPVVKEGEKNQTITIHINELLKIPIRNCGQNSRSCIVIKEKLDTVYEM